MLGDAPTRGVGGGATECCCTPCVCIVTLAISCCCCCGERDMNAAANAFAVADAPAGRPPSDPGCCYENQR
jgi:hypothetical protein